VDFQLGPAILSTAFYLLAVLLAGWSYAARGAVLAWLVAMCLWIGLDWHHPSPGGPTWLVGANELLGACCLGVVGWQGAALGRRQRELTRQRDRLEQAHRELEEEITAARRIQELLQRPTPEHPAFLLAAEQHPARSLGGDVLWFSVAADGRLALALGDVSGRSLPAGLAGVALQALLEDAPRRFSSPGRTLSHLNRRLSGRLSDTMFITLFFAVLDPRTGRLIYANAGHERPFLLRTDGTMEELRIGGMVLGVMPEGHYPEHTEELRPGDLLFGFTDGLAELKLKSGGRLGIEAVQRRLAEVGSQPPDELIWNLLARAQAVAEGEADDLTVVAVRFTGLPTAPDPSVVAAAARPSRSPNALPDQPVELHPPTLEISTELGSLGLAREGPEAWEAGTEAPTVPDDREGPSGE